MMQPMDLGRIRRARHHRSRVCPAAIVAAILLVTACGGSNDNAADTADTTVPATSAPAATTTSVPATTTTVTTTTTTSTTTSTTTTLPPISTLATTTTLPTISTVPPATVAGPRAQTTPVAPPADSNAKEPVIELGTISIPKIGVQMTMYEGIRLTTLDLGPGHWPGTAMPGQVGNVVVGGHRVSKHKVFRNVDQLVAGDEIIFDDPDGHFVYRVTRTEIVEPTAVWIVNPTPTATVTLFACHPPGSTRQRIVVFADLVA